MSPARAPYWVLAAYAAGIALSAWLLPPDRSILVHAAADRDGVLLSGDLAVAGFDQLCAAGLPEPVSLLKLPHNGSRGSRPERFLDRLQPTLAFVSAGQDNPYGLPHPATVAACSARWKPLYRTDHQGTLTFTCSGHAWQAQQQRDTSN